MLYEDYEIKEDGSVTRFGKTLKPLTRKNGRLLYTLSYNGKAKTTEAGRLMAELFVPNPNGYKHYYFIDGNVKNIHANNIAWCEKKRLKNQYWDTDTDKAIGEYNKNGGDDLYTKKIFPALSKCAECVVNRFEFKYAANGNNEELMKMAIVHATLQLKKYDPSKGKGFSYFSHVIKNYCIMENNKSWNYNKHYISTVDSDGEDIDTLEFAAKPQVDKTILGEKVTQVGKFWKTNALAIFKDKKSTLIAQSIATLLLEEDGDMETYCSKHEIASRLRKMCHLSKRCDYVPIRRCVMIMNAWHKKNLKENCVDYQRLTTIL